MEAKDTEMSDEEIKEEFRKNTFNIIASEELIDKIGNAIAITREAQANVSFRAGIREVVEWLKKYRSETTREFIGFTTIREKWQDKLKEWGIEEVPNAKQQ